MFSFLFLLLAAVFGHWARGVGFMAYSLEEGTGRREKLYVHTVSIALTVIAYTLVLFAVIAL